MDKAISNIVVIVVLLAVVAFGVFNSIYNLGNTEQAVIQRFGEVVEIIENEPGIHFKMPFVDTVTIINIQDIKSLQYGYFNASDPTPTSAATYGDDARTAEEKIVLTKGSFMVDVGAIIQYRIVDAEAYLFNCDDQEGTIRLAFESVLRKNIQNKDLDTALLKKEDIATEVKPELQAKLNAYGLGILIDSVKLTDVLLPSAVQAAYDDVNIAKNEKDGYELDAQRYQNENIPQAESEAKRLVNEAKAYKETKLATAYGDVAAFNNILTQYVVSKEITMNRLYIEMMERVLQRTNTKYIIDMEMDGNTIKYLPLNPSLN